MLSCCQSVCGIIDIETRISSTKSSMERWLGKVAIVTGASSGIGAKVCELLVKHGMIVVGLARRAFQIQEMSRQLKNENGKLYAFKCDVSEEKNVLEAFKWTIEEFGPVSVLVNNAGVTVPSTLADGSVEDWKKVLDLNVLGLCVCTREALGQMKNHDINGHIIHINSITGHYVPVIPNINLNVYPASKFAVTALSETLRQEMLFEKRQIKVTSISPGLVKTEWLNGLTPDVKTALSKPEASALDPENVAEVVVFALSTPPQVEVTVLLLDSALAKLETKKCEGGGGLKYLWGDALTDDPECVGPSNKPYPTAAIERSFRGVNPWMASYRTGRAATPKTIDPFLTRKALLRSYELNMGDKSSVISSRQARASSTANTCAGTPSRLCKTRYNTTAPMYGVSLTSGQPVTIVQKFPDLLQQVVFEVCESSECDVVRGECTQTYVPYLFLVIPLGPVTLTGQDYVLVESGCVCRPKYASQMTHEQPSMSSIPRF